MTVASTPDLEVVDFYSESNRRRFAVWYSQPRSAGLFPLLILLHGVRDSGGHGWWLKARVPEVVAGLEAAGLEDPPLVVMPTDTGAEMGSGYADWADGTTLAETFLMAELLPWIESNLPVSGTKWITGLSMGGYGALLLALRHPGTFSSATSTSGFFHPDRLLRYTGSDPRRIWRDENEEHDHDITFLVADPPRTEGLRLAADCGTDDELIDQNRQFADLMAKLELPFGYAEHPGGHDWDYWGAHIGDHVRFHAGLSGPLDAIRRSC